MPGFPKFFSPRTPAVPHEPNPFVPDQPQGPQKTGLLKRAAVTKEQYAQIKKDNEALQNGLAYRGDRIKDKLEKAQPSNDIRGDIRYYGKLRSEVDGVRETARSFKTSQAKHVKSQVRTKYNQAVEKLITAHEAEINKTINEAKAQFDKDTLDAIDLHLHQLSGLEIKSRTYTGRAKRGLGSRVRNRKVRNGQVSSQSSSSAQAIKRLRIQRREAATHIEHFNDTSARLDYAIKSGNINVLKGLDRKALEKFVNDGPSGELQLSAEEKELQNLKLQPVYVKLDHFEIMRQAKETVAAFENIVDKKGSAVPTEALEQIELLRQSEERMIRERGVEIPENGRLSAMLQYRIGTSFEKTATMYDSRVAELRKGIDERGVYPSAETISDLENRERILGNGGYDKAQLNHSTKFSDEVAVHNKAMQERYDSDLVARAQKLQEDALQAHRDVTENEATRHENLINELKENQRTAARDIEQAQSRIAQLNQELKDLKNNKGNLSKEAVLARTKTTQESKRSAENFKELSQARINNFEKAMKDLKEARERRFQELSGGQNSSLLSRILGGAINRSSSTG